MSPAKARPRKVSWMGACLRGQALGAFGVERFVELLDCGENRVEIPFGVRTVGMELYPEFVRLGGMGCDERDSDRGYDDFPDHLSPRR